MTEDRTANDVLHIAYGLNKGRPVAGSPPPVVSSARLKLSAHVDRQARSRTTEVFP